MSDDGSGTTLKYEKPSSEMSTWSKAVRIRRFVIKWATENYGIKPTCAPSIKEFHDLIYRRHKKNKKVVIATGQTDKARGK